MRKISPQSVFFIIPFAFSIFLLTISNPLTGVAQKLTINDGSVTKLLPPTVENPPIGTIIAYGGPVTPAWEKANGWLICDGRPLDCMLQDYQAIF